MPKLSRAEQARINGAKSRLCPKIAAADWKMNRFAAAGTHLIGNEIEVLSSAGRAAGLLSSTLDLTARAIANLIERPFVLRFLTNREVQVLRNRRNAQHLLRQFREKTVNDDENAHIIEPVPLDPESVRCNEPRNEPTPAPQEN